MNTNDTLAVDLRRFAEAAGLALDNVCKAVTIEWFSSTVLSTPVDTGRLRGNWVISKNNPVSVETANTDKSGAGVINSIHLNVGGLGSVTFLTNSLPYAERIEYGYSQQAPAGMVRVNFVRIQNVINAAAARYGV